MSRAVMSSTPGASPSFRLEILEVILFDVKRVGAAPGGVSSLTSEMTQAIVGPPVAWIIN